jgi:hypothetical protein
MTSAARRRALLAVAAALPAACAGPGGPAEPGGPAAAPPHRIRVGDRWRYQLLDRFRNRWLDEPTFEVIETEPELRLQVTGRRGEAPAEERFADAWSALQETFYGQLLVFDSPVPVVPPAPAPGRRMQTTVRYGVGGLSRTRRWSQQLSIGGWQTITVPAGRFRCMPVSRIISLDHPDALKLAATRTDTLWYAPEVGRWVQREWRGEYTSEGGNDDRAIGERAVEDWQLWQLTAWQPSPVSG